MRDERAQLMGWRRVTDVERCWVKIEERVSLLVLYLWRRRKLLTQEPAGHLDSSTDATLADVTLVIHASLCGVRVRSTAADHGDWTHWPQDGGLLSYHKREEFSRATSCHHASSEVSSELTKYGKLEVDGPCAIKSWTRSQYYPIYAQTCAGRNNEPLHSLVEASRAPASARPSNTLSERSAAIRRNVTSSLMIRDGN